MSLGKHIGPSLLLALAGTACAQIQPVAQAAKGHDCLIEPRQVVELRSPVEGVIEHIHVERGGTVKKGQVLVQLESSVERSTLAAAQHRAQMQGRVESARHRVEFATRKLERAQNLLEQNFVSAQVRDEALAEKRLADAELKDGMENQELARLELRRAADQLNLRSIKSPFDGYVVDRLLQPGDLAEAGTGRKPILKLAQLDPLRVEAVLPQEAFGRIRVGTVVQVRPEGSGAPLPARVTVVDRLLDAASATFGVRLELANAKGAVPAGVRCSVVFPGVSPGNGR